MQNGPVDDGITPPRMASSRSRALDEPHIGKYRLIKTIGKGNFAKVKLAKHVPTGREVTFCYVFVFVFATLQMMLVHWLALLESLVQTCSMLIVIGTITLS